MKKIRSISLLAIIILAGCSSTEPVNSRINNVTSQTTNLSNVEQKIRQSAKLVEENILLSEKENFSYFAPVTWASLPDKLEDMREDVADFDPNDQGFFGGPSEKEVMEKINAVQDILSKAERTKGLILNYLKQPMADIAYISPFITKKWEVSFKKINISIIQIIYKLEKAGNTGGLENDRASLQANILKLEIKIALEKYYTPLQKQIVQSDKLFIPITYAQLMSELLKLKDTIQLEPRNDVLIIKMTATVKDSLLRATNVAAEVSWIKNIPNTKQENIALRYRDALNNTYKILFDEDISMLTYEEQMQHLQNSVTDKISALSNEPKTANEDMVVLKNQGSSDISPAIVTAGNITVKSKELIED